MANFIGLSVQSYSKLERGETQLSVARLYLIAEFLVVPVKDILNLDVQQIYNNSHHQKGGSYVAYNNTEIEYVKNLYESLLDEKDNLISHLKNEKGSKKSMRSF